MASFTSTFGDLLGALSQSFRLSVYLPALVFVVINAFTLEPHINQSAFYKAVTSSELLLVSVLITIAVGVAYTLSVLNVPLTQLYEGYAYRDTKIGRLMAMLHYHRKKMIEHQATELEGRADKFLTRFEQMRQERAEEFQKGIPIAEYQSRMLEEDFLEKSGDEEFLKKYSMQPGLA